MKKVILLFTAVVIQLSVAFANHSGPGFKKAVKDLEKKFKVTDAVEWETYCKGYTATFKFNNDTVIVYYNSNGRRVGVGKWVDKVATPDHVLKQLAKDYGDYDICRIHKLTTSDHTIEYFFDLRKDCKAAFLRYSDELELVTNILK